MDVNYCYDRKFEGYILIIGQTGCGKTTFTQNIAKNNLFGELKTGREKSILEFFSKNVNFKYLQSMDEFNKDLDFVQKKTSG